MRPTYAGRFIGLSPYHISPEAPPVFAFQQSFFDAINRLPECAGVYDDVSTDDRYNIEAASERIDATEDLPTITYHHGGTLTKLKAGAHPKLPRRPGLRGKIQDFTRAARRRLLDALNSINQGKLICKPLFVTLTYPATWPADPRVWKRHLDVFAKRLIKKYPTAAFFWKLEFQSRGAPHFHLLVFNVPYMAHKWVAENWWDVVGSGDPLHLAAGTEVRRIRTWRGVLAYAAKYMSKAVQLPLFIDSTTGEIMEHNPGRFWGCVNRDQLPIDPVVMVLTWQEFYRTRRAIWRYFQNGGRRVVSKGRFLGVRAYLNENTCLRLLTHVVLTC